MASTRQTDNGSNPRPDNRDGWLDGETPDVVGEHLVGSPVGDGTDAFEVRLWDPSSQLRFSRKRSVPPRPDGAANTGAGRTTRESEAAQKAA